MNRIKLHLIQIFSRGVSPSRLDAFRVVMPLAVILLFSRLSWEWSGDIPDCMWDPPGMAHWLLPIPLKLDQISLLKTAFLLSMLSLSAGFLSRASSLVAGLCLFFIVGNSIGAQYADRSANSLILVFFVLSLSPSLGTQFSLDSWIFKRRVRDEADAIWPSRLIQFLFFFTFFSAGFSKIAHSGFAWIQGENIVAKWVWAGEAFRSHVLFEIQPLVHNFMIQQVGLAGFLGAVVLILEIFSLTFFASGRWISLGVGLLGLMQLGIFLVMYISFDLFLPLYLIFLPIEKMLRFLGPRSVRLANET